MVRLDGQDHTSTTIRTPMGEMHEVLQDTSDGLEASDGPPKRDIHNTEDPDGSLILLGPQR